MTIDRVCLASVWCARAGILVAEPSELLLQHQLVRFSSKSNLTAISLNFIKKIINIYY